ncbi:hypothetical protein MUP77_12330 [Candidatus Bathyarchaeota archaeon]|nr:hypothetical protein [Candidatus Bathyarchaeota archaeon]
MKPECEIIRVQLWALFTLKFTPSEVDRVKALVNFHLRTCPECRFYLRELLKEKKKEHEEKVKQ